MQCRNQSLFASANCEVGLCIVGSVVVFVPRHLGIVVDRRRSSFFEHATILYRQDWALFEGLLRAKVAQNYRQAEVAQHVMEKASTTSAKEEFDQGRKGGSFQTYMHVQARRRSNQSLVFRQLQQIANKPQKK